MIEDLLDHGGEIAKNARAVLSLIERTVPVERIWLDVSEDVEQTPRSDSSATLIEDLVTALRRAGSEAPVEATLDGLLRSMRIADAALRSAVLEQLRTVQ